MTYKPESGDQRPVTLGKISYRMRMRKPLDSALKFYKESLKLDEKSKKDTKNLDVLLKTKDFNS